MKRFGVGLALALLGSMILGCEGGLKEGPPEGGPKGGVTPEFKAFMQKNANQMEKQAKPKHSPNPAP